MLQVRNLPDDVHAKLKARAAAERMTLSDYVARELAKLVEYRSNAEILQALRARNLERRGGVPPTPEEVEAEKQAIVDAIRAERESR
ncbi:hypothetical protein ET445_04710 [Agromyces protaetiae]|uniref:Antitoxin FitA-like ribbon-helix-helix domain-containing protein n=2 Tax=Agromyces protaetiae TaxID=2509455 RepID=A0A4P6FAP2_9MICO|nr:hypothetical protein ET445_04710 [Agromyces protaetiae]